MLRFSNKYLSIATEQKAYKSLLKPYLIYSCPLRGVSDINSINDLQKLQNIGARIAKNGAYDASSLPRKLGWPTINELIESETVKLVYKSINDQAPIYLAGMFV